ncbi:unnamed protein product, partial [Laminaria digitata]
GAGATRAKGDASGGVSAFQIPGAWVSSPPAASSSVRSSQHSLSSLVTPRGGLSSHNPGAGVGDSDGSVRSSPWRRPRGWFSASVRDGGSSSGRGGELGSRLSSVSTAGHAIGSSSSISR